MCGVSWSDCLLAAVAARLGRAESEDSGMIEVVQQGERLKDQTGHGQLYSRGGID